MLVLSRNRDQSIVVCAEGGIKITVVDIRGDKVRLGIEAPSHVKVHREEVFNTILREEREKHLCSLCKSNPCIC